MDTTTDAQTSRRQDFYHLRSGLIEQIVGQTALVERLLVAILSAGHLIVEGAPGLAKTRAIKALASGLDAEFHRIQFTPDLLPADLTGSDVFRPEDGTFNFQPGPIFHSVLLADEINRAPAKVQSALLEAMGEGQVTAGANTHPLPPLFMVMATQNPIEQEGTYPLPEAQLDRFMLHVVVDYPNRDAGRQILRLAREEARLANEETTQQRGDPRLPTLLSQDTVFGARRDVLSVHLADAVEEYIVELIEATRVPGGYGTELNNWIRWGASPRGAIALERGARALAWLADRDFVTPEDVQSIAADVLRHRIILDFEAEADGITKDQFISVLLSRVPAP